MVELTGLNFEYEHKRRRAKPSEPKQADRRGLDDISLRVGPGTVTGLVGINGSGKSTLLRVLATLLEPQSGEIALFGSPLTRPVSPAIRSRITAGVHRADA